MNVHRLIKGKCATIRGTHAIFDTRADAEQFARAVLRPQNRGRGSVQRCAFGEHYHLISSWMGRRNPRQSGGKKK